MCDLKWVLLGIALWNTVFCTSGVCFGFAALGIPSEVFLVSGGPMFSLATAIVGPLVDAFGPRAASVCGATVSAAGYIVLAFGEVNVADMASYLGLALIVLGGIGPYLGSFCIGALFPKPELQISLITGLFSLGGLSFEACGRLGMSRRDICFFFSGLQLLAVVLCAIGCPARPHLTGKPGHVWLERVVGYRIEAPAFGPRSDPGTPRTPQISNPEILAEDSSPNSPPGNASGNSQTSLQPVAGVAAPSSTSLKDSTNSTPLNATPATSSRSPEFERPTTSLMSRPAAVVVPSYWQGQRRQAERGRLGLLGHARRLSRRLSTIRSEVSMADLSTASFVGQVTSTEYMGMVLWYTLNLTWILYYFTYAGPMANNDLFCQMVGYLGNGMPAVLALFVGNVIANFGWGFATMSTSILSISMLLLSTLQILWLDYVALLFFCVARSMVFPVFFSYIAITFGANNYGRLIGIATLFSGGFGFVNQPLGTWAGFAPSPDAHCAMAIICGSQESCNRVLFTMVACLAPFLLYSVWLCRRKPRAMSDLMSPGPSPPASPMPPRMATSNGNGETGAIQSLEAALPKLSVPAEA